MAIYHLHASVISRRKGRSAVAAAAYRHAEKMLDERQDLTFDYRNKPNVIHSELLIPNNAPTRIKKLFNSESLWNFVEATEKRIDAQLAREIEFALPLELNQEQSIQLAKEFIQDQFVLRGMIADWAVHWDEGNPHVHVMLTMRALTDTGFGQKVVAWNNKALLQEWRKQWAEYANFHLRLHQVNVRIDHRSYQEQGIELIPTLHQKRSVLEMERRGIQTEILKEANSIRKENLQRIQVKPQILFDKITAQQDTFTDENVIRELGRYVPVKPDKDFVLNSKIINEVLKTLEHHESVFKEQDLAKALLPFTQNTDEFVLALQAIKSSDQLIALGVGDDGRERFTSRAMLELEGQIQTIADQLKIQRHHYLSHRCVDKGLKTYQQQLGKSLTEEQLLAVKHLVKHHSITCLVGRAGTGKSFSLGAAHAIWEASGFQVHGIALSGIAADGLSKDAGINSRTIESFRYALSNKTIELSKRDVVVMDETGMTDSVSLLAVLKAIQEAKAKLVLVGDPAQLQPVGPGATFRALLERIGFAELQTVYRQKETWQREATIAFSSGQIAKGLKAYFDEGCIHFAEDEYSTQKQLIEDWQKLRESQDKNKTKTIADYLIIAHRNSDVDTLNKLARAERIKRQEIAPGFKVTTRLGNKEISCGDRLLFLKNDRKLGLSNGRFATILKMDVLESGKVQSITVELDGEVKPGETKKIITLDPQQYSDFTYGYAATVHKVQGMTVDHTLVIASGHGWNKALTYVAQSRHRLSCHLYADKTFHTDLKQLTQNLNRFSQKDSLLDFPLAFSERRGIETGRFLQRFQQFKTNITTRLEQIFDPERYALDQQQALKQTATLQRREDAKVVAAYVDANREVGKCWAAYSEKMTALGFKQIPYGQPVFEVLKTTTEYLALQKAQIERDRLAATIITEPTRYTTALKIYALSLEKLQRESANHQKRMVVEQYLEAQQQGKVIIRDRLAAQIVVEIKNYYATLKAAHIHIPELKQYAKQHARRKFLTTLNSKEREAFNLVENYCQLVKTICQLASQFTKPEDWQSVQSQLHLRDELAYRIASDATTYDKALDFYQIGITNSHTEQLTQEAIKIAQARWYRLQAHAGKHAIRTRIVNYQQALNSQNGLQRQQFAQEIVSDVKIHYREILEAKLPRKTLYQDARAAERRTLFKSVSFEEKQLLRLAIRYQKVNRQVGRSWSRVFKTKENQKKQIAFTLTAKRDYLAHRVLALSQQLEWSALFEGIEVPKAITILREQWKIDFHKLENQSTKHEQRLQTVQDWQALKMNSEKTLAQVIQHHYQSESKNQTHTTTAARYYDWLSANEETEIALKPILQQLNSYQYALHNIGISPKACTAYSASLNQMKQAISQFAHLSEIQDQQTQITQNGLPALNTEQQQKIQRAQNIERGTHPIQGTLAERYLREHRGIQGKLPNTYRYHPGLYCAEAKRRLPALVVIAKNKTSQTQAVQVIFLNQKTANKAKLNTPKLTYGILSQNQVGVLVNRGNESKTIAVAEGPETALSIAEAHPNLTIYAVLGSSNFARVPYSTETQQILFCADNDGKESASQKKLLQAAKHLSKQGLDIWQVMPAQEKQDFNDVLKSEGIAAIQHQLEQPVLLKKAQTLQTVQEIIKQAATQLADKTSLKHMQDEDQKVFHHLLKTYINHELELTHLVTQMHATRFADKTASKDYAQQAHAMEAKIQHLAEEIIQHPNIKNEIQNLSKERIMNMAQLGGFMGIKERLLNQEFTKHDFASLAKHLHLKIQKTSQSLQQNRDRCEHSY